MRVFYNDDYVAMKHSVDATKKPAWVAESLKTIPLRHVDLGEQASAPYGPVPGRPELDGPKGLPFGD